MKPTVAILAGGLATRLRPLTDTIPKALVPIAGEPFVFHQLRLLARYGFRDAVFLIGFLGERIIEAVGSGGAFGIHVRFRADGPVLLGTAGALAHALPELSDPFAVLYGDSWLDFDYDAAIARFQRDGRPALMTITNNEGGREPSNIELSNGEIRCYSKTARGTRMTHIDYGFSLFRKEVFESVPGDKPTDLAAVFGHLTAQGQLANYEVGEPYFEVGSLSGCAQLEAHLARQKAKGVR